MENNMKSDSLSDVKLLDSIEERNKTYGTATRVREATAIIIFFGLNITVYSYLYKYMETERLPTILLVALIGIIGADFTCGVIHWTIDNMGSIETPIVGKVLIAAFREHHIDPLQIIQNDFLTTWGDFCTLFSFLMAVPVLMVISFSPKSITDWYNVILFFAVWTSLLCCSNQTHKWAHTRTGLPVWVKILQKLHIVLPIKHHHVHHLPPHLVKYCALNGLANYPLDYINFWNKLEWVVEKLTGLKPRQDDMKWSKKKYKYLKLFKKKI